MEEPFAAAIVDRYVIQRELGRGGSASVFRGRGYQAPAIMVNDTLPPGFNVTDVTRDGKTLLVTRREQQSDAWLIELPAR